MRLKYKNILKIFLFLTLPFILNLQAEEQKILKIVGWDIYADPDQPDKTIGFKLFEQKTGMKTNFTPLSSLDAIVEASESNEIFDVIIISNDGIRLLKGMELLMPINLYNVPNYQNLHPNLQYSEWTQFDSKVYAVPWAWGPTGLMFDTDIISQAASWNLLWDQKYKGQLAMWDDISMIWTTALSLGYKNIYNLTKVQMDEVKRKLFKFNRLSGEYYKGSRDEIELIKKKNIVAYNSWYNSSSRLKSIDKNFSMVLPSEGAPGMFDSYLISKRSKNVEIAHQYINYQISPAVQQEMIKLTGLAPANIETLSLLTQTEIKTLHLDDPDFFNRILLWDNMPRKYLYQELIDAVRNDLKQVK